MTGFILGLSLFLSGFIAGYGLRAWLSHRRRHPGRKKFAVNPARF